MHQRTQKSMQLKPPIDRFLARPDEIKDNILRLALPT
jgi:hypothetical protein